MARSDDFTQCTCYTYIRTVFEKPMSETITNNTIYSFLENYYDERHHHGCCGSLMIHEQKGDRY